MPEPERRAIAPAIAPPPSTDRPSERGRVPGALAACAALVFLAGACDSAFEPIAEGEVHFSVFGYLNAAADTQWVRVMPIRPVAATDPDAPGITVTLEEVGTGRVIALHDSLFAFSGGHTGQELGSEGAWVHDFWTTEPIAPGGAYRFSAVRAGEAPAEALVDVPRDYAVEVWLDQQAPGWGNRLRISGAGHVPFLTAYTHFTDRCGDGLDSLRYEVEPDDQGSSEIAMPYRRLVNRDGCGTPTVGRRELLVVSSGATWPTGEAYSPWGLAAPERASNVSNAVGFLGGVFTKVIPWEACTFDTEVGPAPAFCILRYDAEAASMAGTIEESRCGDGPIAEVTVRLRELVDPPAVPRIRELLTDGDGSFSFGALEPGSSWFLWARAKPLPVYGEGELDIYALHTDTLTFASGERTRYDIALPRLTPCDQKP